MRSDSVMTLDQLRQEVLAFRDARDWAQFHHPKDLAVALSIEAAEVLELFRFRNDAEVSRQVEAGDLTDLAHELADVLYWVLLLSHEVGVDLSNAMEEKLAFNAQRYPVELSRGRKEKYTALRAGREDAEAQPEPDPIELNVHPLKATLLRRAGEASSDERPAVREDHTLPSGPS